jgi:hypothetical protein
MPCSSCLAINNHNKLFSKPTRKVAEGCIRLQWLEFENFGWLMMTNGTVLYLSIFESLKLFFLRFLAASQACKLNKSIFIKDK